MGFWIFMFCCTLLIPIIMIIAGNSMRLGKFKTINSIVGYRTRRSMKNQQTWDYAHRECGLLWRRWGSTMLVLTVIAMLLFMGGHRPHWGGGQRYYRVADDPPVSFHCHRGKEAPGKI